mgnify:CR=1 FL=1
MVDNIENIRDFREPDNPSADTVVDSLSEKELLEVLVLGITPDGELSVSSSKNDLDWILGMFDWFITKYN